MRRRLIILGLALVLGLIAGPAMAQNFDAVLDPAFHPGSGNNIRAEIWVRSMPGTDLWGMDFDVTYDPSELTLVSVEVNDDTSPWGGCLVGAFTITSDTGPGVIYIGGGKMPGTTCPFAGDYMLAEIVLTAVGDVLTQICVGGVTGDPGWVHDDTGQQFPTPLCVDIIPPPCTTVISPDPAVLMGGDTFQFTSTNTGFCDPSNIMWTDTCALGDVDGSGLLTTVGDLIGETCQVCSIDMANTDSCNEAGSNCCSDVTIWCGPLCTIEIYTGGAPVPPLNTYNRPGRRGIAATCCSTIQFSTCTDCTSTCQEWSISVLSGSAPMGTSINVTSGLLTIGCDCSMLDAPVELEVTVTDPCNYGTYDSIIIIIGEVILEVINTNAHPDDTGVEVTLNLTNPDHKVKGIATDVAACGGLGNPDYLECTGCSPDPDRAPEFMCSANEQPDGSCRVILLTTNPTALIDEGEGAVLTIQYNVAPDAPADECLCLWPYNRDVSDRFNDELCTCGDAGLICFFVCGDVYPADCLGQPICGDGAVDIFDILEEIDFVLGMATPTTCQLIRADVPNGTPPYCSAPDGDVDIFDVLVIIDMALGKANCCDYYYFGEIY